MDARCSPKTIGMNKYLEPLFKHLKKYSKKGVVGLTYSEIEQLIGEELSYGAKAFDHYWTQPSVKRIMSKYGIKVGYINTLTGMIYFEVL